MGGALGTSFKRNPKFEGLSSSDASWSTPEGQQELKGRYESESKMRMMPYGGINRPPSTYLLNKDGTYGFNPEKESWDRRRKMGLRF